MRNIQFKLLAITFLILLSPLVASAQLGVRQEDAPPNPDESEIIINRIDYFISNISLDKPSYQAGETVNGTITILNNGDSPEFGLRYSMSLVSDFGDFGIPNNVFGFDQYEDLELEANSKREIPFSYTLPGSFSIDDASIGVRIFNLSETPTTFNFSPKFVITGGQKPITVQNSGFVFEKNYSPEIVVYPDSGPVISRDGANKIAYMIARLANDTDADVALIPHIVTSDFIDGDRVISEKDVEPIVIPAKSTATHLYPVELFDYKPGVYASRVTYRENGADRTKVLYYKYVIAGDNLVSIEDVSVDTQGPVYSGTALNTNIVYTAGVYDFLAAGDDGTNENGIDEDFFVGLGKEVSVLVEFYNSSDEKIGEAGASIVTVEDGSLNVDVPVTSDTGTIKAVVTFTDSDGTVLDKYEKTLFEGDEVGDLSGSYKDHLGLIAGIGVGALALVVLALVAFKIKKRKEIYYLFALLFGLSTFFGASFAEAGIGIWVSGTPEEIEVNTGFSVFISAAASVCKNRSGWVSSASENIQVDPLVAAEPGHSIGYYKFWTENDNHAGDANWSGYITIPFTSGSVVGTRTVHAVATLKKHNNNDNSTDYDYANSYYPYEVISENDMCPNLSGIQETVSFPYEVDGVTGDCLVPITASCQAVDASTDLPLSGNPVVGQSFMWKASPASSGAVPLIYTWTGDATNQPTGSQRYAVGQYGSPGTYTANIQIEQDIEAGQTDTGQCSVTVVDQSSVTCEIQGGVSAINTGDSVTFNAVPNNANGTPSYTWSGIVSGSGSSKSYTALTAGTHQATVQMTDLNGTDTDICTIVVTEDEDVDLCPNLIGDQKTIPTGYEVNSAGDCVLVDVIDICSNIAGNQENLPTGKMLASDGTCVNANSQDVCKNLAGVQTAVPDEYHLSGSLCVPDENDTDVCENLDGNQTVIPTGYFYNYSTSECELITSGDSCPNIDGSQASIPDGYYKDSRGNCSLIGGVVPNDFSGGETTEF